MNPKQMDAQVKWQPFSKGREEVFKSNNDQITLSFRDIEKLDEGLREAAVATVKEFISQGYDYIMQATDRQLVLSKKFLIEFSNRDGHGHQGALMRISISTLTKTLENRADEASQHLERSSMAHELIHNITDDEDFPMFIEMIYLSENGQHKRLEEIELMLRTGKLPNQYIRGLSHIARWLGCNNDAQELFGKIKSMKVEELKLIFKTQILEYYKKEMEPLKKKE